MTQVLDIHPTDPQQRLLAHAVTVLRQGGLVVYPTDTTYALACQIGDKAALAKLVQLRRLHRHHQFTLACRDLSELGTYARVNNMDYRLLKRCTPGPFTFVLRASREVPKRLVHEKRKTIGLRVPDHVIALDLLASLGEPLMTTTLRLPDEEAPLRDAYDILAAVGPRVDLILDGGVCGAEPSTVVDLTGALPEIVRQGKGELDFLHG